MRGRARTGAGARRACMRRQARGRTSEGSARGAGRAGQGAARRAGACGRQARGARQARRARPAGRGLGAACARELGQVGVLCTLTRFFGPCSTRYFF